MKITTVNIQEANHRRVLHSWGYGPTATQGHLALGDVNLIVTAHGPKDAEASLLALEAVAAHALALADKIRAVQQSMVTEAGCSCGWRGSSDEVDAHSEVCLLPDPDDLARQEAERDGFLDNADPDMDAAGADDYLADVAP